MESVEIKLGEGEEVGLGYGVGVDVDVRVGETNEKQLSRRNNVVGVEATFAYFEKELHSPKFINKYRWDFRRTNSS